MGACDLKNSLGYAEYECAFKLKPLHNAFWTFRGEITIGDFKLTYDEKGKIIHGRVKIRLETVDDNKALSIAKDKIEKELMPLLTIVMRTPLEFNPNEVIIAKPNFKHIPTAKIVVHLEKIPHVKVIPNEKFKKNIIRCLEKYSLLGSKDKEILELAIKFLNKGASSKNLIERTLCDFISLELLASRLTKKKDSCTCRKKDSWVEELEKKYNVSLSYEGCRINQIRAALVHGKAKLSKKKRLNAEEAMRIIGKHINELEQTIIRLIEKFLERNTK